MKMPNLVSGTVPVPDPTKLTTDAVSSAKTELLNIIDIKLEAIKDLFNEKFERVHTEFIMRDTALTAAFKAAEAAVEQQNKSNTLAIDKAATATTKQIDMLNEKIEDNKTRIGEIAGRNWATVGAYIVGAMGIIGIVLAVLSRSAIRI